MGVKHTQMFDHMVYGWPLDAMQNLFLENMSYITFKSIGEHGPPRTGAGGGEERGRKDIPVHIFTVQ